MDLSRILVIFCYLIKNALSGAIGLNSGNIDSVLLSNDIVFINYYANWCRFSQMLQPIYDEFADKFTKENSDKRVAIAKVDCDGEQLIAQKYNINKYPTLKLYRNGIMMKREYRGARSVDAFMQYLQEQSVNPIKQLTNTFEINQHDFTKKPTLIGYFESDSSENYRIYEKLANVLRENCDFVSLIGESSIDFRQNGDQIYFRRVTVSQSHKSETF
jgi:endoplasmic reticulum resident protein 44